MIIYLLTSILLFLVLLIFITKLVDVITSSKAPAISTPVSALKQIHTALQIAPDDVVWEIGCGDGRVLSYCAYRHPEASFVGIENGIQMYLRAKWRTRGQGNIQINFKNFNNIPPKNANKIFLYLLPDTLDQYQSLIPRGTRVVSLEYKIPSKKIVKSIALNKPTRLVKKIFIYLF